ncbi:MAG: DUF927 domain-containing protein [Desulfovibrio sp.]|nr:DUF927 domain-containing protein [Desulfovibrio sp.]
MNVLSFPTASSKNLLDELDELDKPTALCLDEIGQAPGRTIMEASYMLANGMGKSRASVDGSARAVKSWRRMVLSTGEKGLAEKIMEEGGRVQAGLGLFENLHGHDSPQAFADALKQASATNYGHAARAFIECCVVQRGQSIRDDLHTALEKFTRLSCPDGADGQVLRGVRRCPVCRRRGRWRLNGVFCPGKKVKHWQPPRHVLTLGLNSGVDPAWRKILRYWLKWPCLWSSTGPVVFRIWKVNSPVFFI